MERLTSLTDWSRIGESCEVSVTLSAGKVVSVMGTLGRGLKGEKIVLLFTSGKIFNSAKMATDTHTHPHTLTNSLSLTHTH